MRNLFVRFALFACIASLYTISSGTSLNVLKVAQANFLIVKNETHALIFDCGTKEAGWTERRGVEFTDAKKGLIKNLLAEVKNITILISHNHDDHRNLLIPLTNLIKETSTIKCSFLKSWEKTDAEIQTSVINALGSNVKITPLLARSASSDPNDNSVVLKLTTNGRNILLTGDATGRIVREISKDIRDTDVFLFSHHGSNESGELSSIMEYLPPHPVLGIISSDINGASRIPRFYPSYKEHTNTGPNFLQVVKKIVFPISEMSEGVFCVSHNISFYNQLIDSPQTIPACLVDEKGISIVPVFSTGDMGDRGLFYKISVAPDGTINMTRNADITHVLYKLSPGTGTAAARGLSYFALPDQTPVNVMSALLADTTNLIRQAVRDKETSFKSLGVTSRFIM